MKSREIWNAAFASFKPLEKFSPERSRRFVLASIGAHFRFLLSHLRDVHIEARLGQ
jgi:hypothetical protein